MLFRNIAVGLGLLSCLLAVGCANGPFRHSCTTRPAVVNTVPIGNPPCNGCAPGAPVAPVPGAPVLGPGSVVPPPAPIQPGAPAYSSPVPGNGGVIVPGY